MKIITPKRGANLLLFVAAIPLIYTSIFRVEQMMIRRKMKEKFESQLLHTITITKNDIHWIDEGKEILVNGEMFDIKSSSIENEYYSFTGLYDKEETALIIQLENAQQQTSSSNHKALSDFFQWLQSFYHDSPQMEDLAGLILNQGNLFSTPAVSDQFIGIVIPPPKEC